MKTQIEPAALRLAINQVKFATASDDSRPVLTGIHTEFDGEKATLAAADGFRLAVHTTPISIGVSPKTEAIIPGRALAELDRLLVDQKEAVEIVINPEEGYVRFSLKDTELVSQLLQGAFPNYRQLIPQKWDTRAVGSTAEFLRAASAASILARDDKDIVRLQVTPGAESAPGKLLISTWGSWGESAIKLCAVVEGQPAKIAFNGKYLQEVLAVLPADGKVSLEFTTPSSPGVIRPVGLDNYVHVLMPMEVQWDKKWAMGVRNYLNRRREEK